MDQLHHSGDASASTDGTTTYQHAVDRGAVAWLGHPATIGAVLWWVALDAGGGQPVPFPTLTDRERQVLRLVAEGHNNRKIAETLFLSTKTVANHVSNILNKLHLGDRAEAIVRARQAGLTDSDTRHS